VLRLGARTHTVAQFAATQCFASHCAYRKPGSMAARGLRFRAGPAGRAQRRRPSSRAGAPGSRAGRHGNRASRRGSRAQQDGPHRPGLRFHLAGAALYYTN
jgi:hypothetical protein